MKKLKVIFAIFILNLATISLLIVGASRVHSSTSSVTTNIKANQASNQCIVTIQGNQYDVSKLRKTHSGGDVFTCNTDMTDVFFSMHDNGLLNSQMQQYLVK